MAGKNWIALGAFLAAVAVAAGAMGAHYLKGLVAKEQMTADQLALFETAVRYQMFHALGLVLAGLIIERHSGGLLQAACVAFVIGVLLFSGGIYGWLATGSKPLVMIVPVGGVSWIIGWLLLALGSWLSKSPADLP